jgi:hypothetical protein
MVRPRNPGYNAVKPDGERGVCRFRPSVVIRSDLSIGGGPMILSEPAFYAVVCAGMSVMALADHLIS